MSTLYETYVFLAGPPARSLANQVRLGYLLVSSLVRLGFINAIILLLNLRTRSYCWRNSNILNLIELGICCCLLLIKLLEEGFNIVGGSLAYGFA